MFNRLSGWQYFGMALAVLWTIVMLTVAWINLPRARHVPHDSQFLSKLSPESATILRGTAIKARSVRGAPVWLDTTRVVRMSNGAELTLPSVTTDGQAAMVASEYRQLLHAEAVAQRWLFLLAMLGIWLTPALLLSVASLAAALIRDRAALSSVFADERIRSRRGPTLA